MKELIEVFDSESLKTQQNKCVEGYNVVIFKYSPACSISYYVEKTFKKWFENLPEETKLVAVKVNVIESRNLSREIASEFNIRHESPQAIWLDSEGSVKWQASHSSIRSEDLNSLLGLS